MVKLRRKKADVQKQKIVLLHGNTQLTDIMRGMLSSFGVHNVYEVKDIDWAHDLLHRIRPTFAIVDYKLSQSNGVEFVRTVRNDSQSADPQLPILMMAKHARRQHVMEAINVGVNEFLALPIHPKGFYRQVDRIINHPWSYINVSWYFGPDRRRLKDPTFNGPFRREGDFFRHR